MPIGNVTPKFVSMTGDDFATDLAQFRSDRQERIDYEKTYEFQIAEDNLKRQMKTINEIVARYAAPDPTAAVSKILGELEDTAWQMLTCCSSTSYKTGMQDGLRLILSTLI